MLIMALPPKMVTKKNISIDITLPATYQRIANSNIPTQNAAPSIMQLKKLLQNAFIKHSFHFIFPPRKSTWKLILQEFTKFFWDNVKNYFYFITLCLFLQICCFTLYCNCIFTSYKTV